MPRRKRLRYFLSWAGPLWTLLYLTRQVLARVVYRVNRRMMRIEEKRFLTGEMTVSAEFNTAERNALMWNRYDWTRGGEEWSEQATVQRGIDAAEWKRRLVSEALERYMPEDGALLEVGPGGGRWTELLLPRSRRLILVDVAERCLELCRERFNDDPRIQYCLVDPRSPSFIRSTAVPDDSVDGVWSYDAFVHINPTDIATYLGDFARILRPGGIGVIHHTGRSPNDWDYAEAFRSQMNARFFARLLDQRGLEIIEQTDALVHKPGDVITVFRKPALS
jgi:ubiquinone/menaquinone biosynthesis C-methylase UbiE